MIKLKHLGNFEKGCLTLLIVIWFTICMAFIVSMEDVEIASAMEKSSEGVFHITQEKKLDISLQPVAVRADETKNLNNFSIDNFTDTQFIKNSAYFLKNPKHAANKKSDNVGGTCTTVAMQLLMGYHNYYSDRRIIPEIGVNGKRFLCENYGNLDYSPAMNGDGDKTGLGIAEFGTEDAFFYELFDLTTWAEFPGLGQNLPAVKNAANDFMVKHSPEIRDSVSIKFSTFSYDDAIYEINVGRPIILGYEPVFSSGPSFHVVVAYGYASLNGVKGFIVHQGYYGDKTQIWVPESWFGYQVRMEVSHRHNFTYSTDNDYPGYITTTCRECGCVLLERMYKLDDTGTITYVYYPMESYYVIPSEMYGQKVTAIGQGAFSDSEAKGISVGEGIKRIEDDAFSGCSNLLYIILPSTLETIGRRAFLSTSSLISVSIPSSVREIGAAAFAISGIGGLSFGSDSQLKTIGEMAFAFCTKLVDVTLPESLITLGDGAFLLATGLESVFIPSSISTVGTSAFTGCTELTVYTSRTGDDGWHEKWNSQNRPVVWGCTTSENWVVSFTKTDTNPENVDADTVLNNPTRAGYTFAGWYTNADFSGTQYMDLASAPSGTLYAKWTESACVAAGTLITLADGSQVPVEELTGDEMLLVWNLFTGEFDVAPILFIDSEAAGTYEVITLTFSDGTTLKVIDEHALWDFDLNEYVFMRSDAAKYIGHWFNKQTYDAEGNMIYTRVQLTGVTVTEEYTSAWSPVTYGHLCFYVNGMLSMPGATTGLINIFDVDPDTMTIDEEQYLADIAQYGLFTYEEFAVMYPVPEEIFDAFGGQYLKVAMGKGLLTTEMIEALINRYSEFF